MLICFRIVLTAVVCLLFSGAVYAQATRTWVSGVGDDVNPCSRTAPCKTFAGAISKTATGGVISVLDPGGFGAVTITKAITIDGGGIEGSILSSGTNGIVINITSGADQVMLRNLTIYGTGTGLSGIKIMSSSHVTIERVVISGHATGIEKTSSGQVYVYDSFIHGNTTYGMLISSGRANLDRVRLDHNGFDGLRVTNGGETSVRRSVVAGHVNNFGISATFGGYIAITDSTISNNAYGIGSIGGSTITVANTNISSSTVQGLYSDAGQLLSFGNNTLSANAINGNFTGNAVQR